jgi:hypothetical protein
MLLSHMLAEAEHIDTGRSGQVWAETTADDTDLGLAAEVRGHGLRTSLMLREVEGEVSHWNEIEGYTPKTTLTIEAGIPDLDVKFSIVGKVLERHGCRCRTLTSKVDSSLQNVPGSAAIVTTTTDSVFSGGRVAVRGKQTDGAGAIHRTLKLGEVVWAREHLLGAGVAKLAGDLSVNVRVEETRATEGSLLHDGGVAELLDQSLTTLDGGVRDLGGLVGTITNPGATLDVVDQVDHAVDVGEVDEGITDVATGLEVNAKVHEVVGTKALLVEDGLEGQLQQG